jgi:hypothetical protein
MTFWNALIPTAKTALIYVTAGSVGLVWSGIWYLYLVNNPPSEGQGLFYVVGGFALTSLVLIGIGLAYGYVFPMARSADILTGPTDVLPATPVTPTVPGNMTVNIVPTPGNAVPVLG